MAGANKLWTRFRPGTGLDSSAQSNEGLRLSRKAPEPQKSRAPQQVTGVTHGTPVTSPGTSGGVPDPIYPAPSPPGPARWRPLSLPSAPGHSPRRAAVVACGAPGLPCRQQGGVADLELSLGLRCLGEHSLVHSTGQAPGAGWVERALECGAKRPGHQRPAAELAGTGRRRRQQRGRRRRRRRGEEGGADKSDAMGGRLIPSAPGWPLAQPPLPAVERLQLQVSDLRSPTHTPAPVLGFPEKDSK